MNPLLCPKSGGYGGGYGGSGGGLSTLLPLLLAGRGGGKGGRKTTVLVVKNRGSKKVNVDKDISRKVKANPDVEANPEVRFIYEDF